MNFGNKRGKIGREKESLSQLMDFITAGGGAKSRIIIPAVFLALLCLSTTALGVGTIKGHIDGSGGSSLVNVWLNLYQGSDPQVADENAWDYVTWAQTDSSGNYQFSNLAPRHYHIYIGDQDVGGTTYARTDVYNIPVVDNVDTVRNITLQEAGSISGYVYDPSGNPLQDVWVEALQGEDENIADWRAWWWVGDAQTDINGKYTINGLGPRRYRVHIYDQDVGGTHYVDTDLYNVQVFAGIDTPNMDFTLRQAAKIEGYIKTSGGIPIPNAWVISDVSWTHKGWDWHDAWTDQNGKYELWVLPSPGEFYPVWVRHAKLPGTTYKVYGGNTQISNWEDKFHPGDHGYTLLGTDTGTQTFNGEHNYYIIVTDDGFAAKVDAVQGSDDSYYSTNDYGNTLDGQNVSGQEDGNYAFVGYMQGYQGYQGGYIFIDPPYGNTGNTSLKVYIVDDSRSNNPVPYESKWEKGNLFKATLGQPTIVNYALDPGGEVTGRVVNESNVGIEGVRVQLGWNKYGDFGDEARTDSDGNFRLGGLTVGNDNYVVLDNWEPIMQGGVKYMTGEAYKGPINITTGGQVKPIGDFTIYEAGIVTGVVTDENGDPVVAVEVDLEGRDIDGNWAESEWGITDSFGQYTLDYVAPGTYFLECEKPGFLTTKIPDIKVDKGQHVDLDVVINSQAKGAIISGSITNYSDIAAYDSVNQVYYPYYEDNDYDEYGLTEFGLVAMKLDKTYTDEDYLEIDQFFVGDIEDEDIQDGYGDYFELNPSETKGNYTMPVHPGDIGIGMYIDNPETLAGWGGSAILHDWKRFTLTQGDDKPNIDFTANIGSTGELKGKLIVPLVYTYFPGDWCVIYAFALDSSGNRINPGVLCDAVAFCGFTTQYEFVNMPVGNYELRAFARNLPSVVVQSVTVYSGLTTTQDIDLASMPSGSLTGLVKSGVTLVEGAMVTIVENGRQAITDSSGIYMITGINYGTYTVKVTASGFADAQQDNVNIDGSNTLNFSLDSQVGSISGTVKDDGGNNVNGAPVVAYNETDKTQKTDQTVGGEFNITGLTYGDYILAVDAGVYGVVVYPDDGSRITLDQINDDITGIPIVVDTPEPPLFTVTSSVSNDTPPVLSMEFYSDQGLNVAPTVSIVEGSGSLGNLTSNSALNRFNRDYTAVAGDTLVKIRIEENSPPLVSGSPGWKEFSFEVSTDLVTTSSTNVTNATGGTASIMGTQDNTEIYVPPFAIAGAGSDTQALALTIERYGDPGQTVPGTTGTTASAVYDFKFDETGVSIDENHTFTVTMSFELPAGMTEAEFENTLELRYFDAGDQKWKTDGISNKRINWLNYTIMFEVSHLSKFAVFVGDVCCHPADSITVCDNVISTLEILAYIDKWAVNDVTTLEVLEGIDLWAAGEYHCDQDGNYKPGEKPGQ